MGTILYLLIILFKLLVLKMITCLTETSNKIDNELKVFKFFISSL